MKTLQVDLTKSSAELIDNLPPERPRAVVLGFFDGIHRGHQELVRTMVSRSAELGIEPCVFSFDRYPKPVPGHVRLNATANPERNHGLLLQSPLPDSRLPFKGLLQTSEQRDEIFAEMGIDKLILQTFNRAFAGLLPEEFCQKILVERLNAKVVVVGDDYRFAKAQKGNVEFLREWGERQGIEVIVVPAIRVGGEVLSSSKIRAWIEEGNMPSAARMMGRYFRIPGRVIHGNALGRTVGMPTANLRIPAGMESPMYGVYGTRTKVDDTWYDSVTNIGLRPTVNHTDPLPLVETCILDRRLDLYGKDVEVEFLELSRPEIRFPSFIVMSTEIAKDLAKAREWHQVHEKMYLYKMQQDIPVMLSRSTRFNTSYLVVEVLLPLAKETASAYSLLANVLTAATEKYPKRTELVSFLDQEYGAEISVDIDKVNALQKLSFRLSAVHTGLDGSSPFANCVDTLLDMLLRPARDEEDHFLPEIMETERQNLQMTLLAEENDLSNYAFVRAKEELLKPGFEYVNPLGDSESLLKLTAEDLRDAWVTMLARGRIQVFLFGNLPTTELADRVALRLATIPRASETLKLVPGILPFIPQWGEEKEVRETRTAEVAHVICIYDGMPSYASIHVLDGHVLTLMLASFPQSLLYRIIREELGYAYYVDAVYDPFSRTLTVIAEVDPEEVAETLAIIDQEILDLASGKFEDLLLDAAKKYLQTTYQQAQDDSAERLHYESEEYVAGSKYSSEEVPDYVAEIEASEIQKLASGLRKAVTYVLEPKSSSSVATSEGGL